MEARGCVLNHAGIHIPSISLVLLPLSGFKPRLAISRFLTYLRQISRLTDLAQCRNRGWPNYCGAFFFGALGCGQLGRCGAVCAHAGLRVGLGLLGSVARDFSTRLSII